MPLLAPVVGVTPVVMVPRARDRDLEEVGVTQDRCGRGEATTRVAEDPRSLDIDPLVLLGELAHPCDLVLEHMIAHIALVGSVELLRSHRCAYLIYLHHVVSQLYH